MSLHTGGGVQVVAEPRGFLHRQGWSLCDRRSSPGCRGYESGQGLESYRREQGWRVGPCPWLGECKLPTEDTLFQSTEFGGTYCAPGHGPVPVDAGSQRPLRRLTPLARPFVEPPCSPR